MDQRSRLIRYAGIAVVVAAGLRALYSATHETGQLALSIELAPLWFGLYLTFAIAYAFVPGGERARDKRLRGLLLGTQSVTGLSLVLLYPNFIVVTVCAIVIWQVTLTYGTRAGLALTIVQSLILALIKCTGETEGMTWIVLVTSFGYQLFAFFAAQLLRNEMQARHDLARANSELRAAQHVLAETAASEERLRIARDLHDVVGHNLTSLTIQLDVAHRLANDDASAHIETARRISADLLEQVRQVVARFREHPLDFRRALHELAENTGDLKVHLSIPAGVQTPDPARAEAIVRCVQEIVTNALRHSEARNLTVDLRQVDNDIVVTGYDDGKGGDIREGRGLTGIRERFAAFGGVVTVGKNFERGLRVIANMPLAEHGQ